jgi:8-oxo-dGTP pyrophosphatase MutT (NUDIX family)
MSAAIRPVSLCLLVHNNKVLLQEFKHLDSYILRPPGGGIDFGEYAVEAVRREIMEEVGSPITEPQLIQILEHPRKFVKLNDQRHEIIFLYQARLLREELHDYEVVPLDDNGHPGRAYWFSTEQLLTETERILEPPMLLDILTSLVFKD